MLDPKFVRENITKVKISETKRGHGIKFLETFLKNDELWRNSKSRNEKLFEKGDIREDRFTFVKYLTKRPIMKNGFYRKQWQIPENKP